MVYFVRYRSLSCFYSVEFKRVLWGYEGLVGIQRSEKLKTAYRVLNSTIYFECYLVP